MRVYDLRKARSIEEETEFLEWLMHHNYKEAPQSKWKISEDAARGWMARIRKRYQKQRQYINQVTSLMKISPRIRKMLLSGAVPNEEE